MSDNKKKYRYPGTRPFTIAEKELFFGRDRDIKELIQLVKLYKQVVLYGKSGLGKSSIINAGVIPQLREEEEYEAIHVRFGSYSEFLENNPTDILRQTIQNKISFQNFLWKDILEIDPENADEVKSKQEIELLENPWCYLKSLQIENPEKKSFLLIFDQFEELFTYPEKDVEKFSAQLEEMLHVKVPRAIRQNLKNKIKEDKNFIAIDKQKMIFQEADLRIVFSIRSDKLSLLNNLKKHLPDVLQNTFELTPLSVEQARDAIIKPAELNQAAYDFHSPSFKYAQSALDLMLDFLSRKKQQKIETFQLQILCEHAESIILKRKNDSGENTITKDALGDVVNIFENYYDNQIEKINNADEQKLARVFIEEGLIFEEDNRRLSVYEGQAVKMYHINKELLDKLVATRIIRTEPHPSGGFSYELSHDTLVAPILKAKEKRIRSEKWLEAETERRKVERKRRMKIIRYSAIILAIVSVAIAFLAINIVSVNKERDKIALQRDSLNQKNEEIESLYQTLRDRTIKSVQLEYDKMLAEGNTMKSQGNYLAAIAKYKEALKRVEGYDLDTTVLLENIRFCEKTIESSGEFFRLIGDGDKLVAQNDESLYLQALQKYQQAKATGSNNALAQQKINNLNSKINSQFEYYKKKGLEALSLNNNPGKNRAKQLFNKALVLKPGDEFIKQKIIECGE